MSDSTHTRAGVRRLVAAVGTAVVLGAGAFGLGAVAVDSQPPAVPKAKCGPGALPETSIQGRVPLADYLDGRAAKGYRCNTRLVAHQGRNGGFKVLRYRDSQGHLCAYYDSTLLFPKDVLFNAVQGLGVVVIDMADVTRPRPTATLTSPAMLSPHESLLVNQKRGLLAGVLGNPATNVGILDVYDVHTDCRHPRLLSSSDSPVLGHESGWAPDGRTFWAASTGGFTLAAIDLTNPSKPKRIFFQAGVSYHGLRLSSDGKTMYVADIGTSTAGALQHKGLRILDVSQVQARRADPKVTIKADLTWRTVSIPQVAEPFTKNGHQYLLEVDEYANYSASVDPRQQPVGAARIINIDDPRHPYVVSDLRLQVHQQANRQGDQWLDPGAQIPVQGYAAHYCSLPTKVDPKIAGCSMILSGLRLFDIRDLHHPKEVGYFNEPFVPLDDPTADPTSSPTAIGGFAMSQPAWDVAHDSVWYTDGNSGFYNVRLTNGVQNLLP